jgi:nucleoside-diphosphate-sugar epimerase
MKVLITGCRGFLGRHFAKALAEKDPEGRRIGLDVRGHEYQRRDAREFFLLDRTQYDLVLHLAAVSPHRAAIDGRALAVGAGGLALDAAMFEWAARTRPGRVVYFSSSAAYPVAAQQRPGVCLLEGDVIDFGHGDDIGEPDAIYGWVKLTGERLADAYRAQGGAVTVVRPFSGYGEDQSSNFPFGAFRDRALAREDPFIVWGDGQQVRDWIHVDDLVGATLAAVDHEVDGPLNLCTGIGTSMRELAELFTATAGYRPHIELRPDQPTGVANRVVDPTRLHEIYTPRVTLEEGVKRALA